MYRKEKDIERAIKEANKAFNRLRGALGFMMIPCRMGRSLRELAMEWVGR